MLNESWAAAIANGYETDLSGLVNANVVNVDDGFVDVCCMTIDDTIYEVHSSYGSPITPDMVDEFKSGNFEKIIKFLSTFDRCLKNPSLITSSSVEGLLFCHSCTKLSMTSFSV